MIKQDSKKQKPRFPQPQKINFGQLRKDVLEVVEREKPRVKWQIKAKAFLFPLLYITVYALLLWKGANPYVFFLSYIGLGLLLVFNFLNLIHDAVHGTIFKSRKLNRLYVKFFDLMGANSYIWKIRHTQLHHAFPNIMDWDSDFEQSPLVRVFPQSEKMPIHNNQHLIMPFVYPLYLFNWLLVRDFKDFFNKNMIVHKVVKKIPSIEYVKLIGFKLFFLAYLLVIPKLVLGVSWLTVFGGFVLLMFAASIFSLIVLLSPHANIYSEFPEPSEENEMPHSWFEHQLRVTNDVANDSWFVRFFMASFNFHIAHHLFPKIHHVYYPEVTKVIERFAKENNLPYRKQTLFGSLKAHWELLRQNAVTENIFEETM